MYPSGRYSYSSDDVIIRYDEGISTVKMGSFCSIADRVEFFLAGNHRMDWITTFPFGSRHTDIFPCDFADKSRTKGDINIGNDVWIGSGAKIFSGVTIGDGAVIGAFANVASDVEPYTIVVGNPARPVRKRFSDAHIKLLLENPWWELSDDKIRVLVPYLCSPDVDALIEQIKELKDL